MNLKGSKFKTGEFGLLKVHYASFTCWSSAAERVCVWKCVEGNKCLTLLSQLHPSRWTVKNWRWGCFETGQNCYCLTKKRTWSHWTPKNGALSVCCEEEPARQNCTTLHRRHRTTWVPALRMSHSPTMRQWIRCIWPCWVHRGAPKVLFEARASFSAGLSRLRVAPGLTKVDHVNMGTFALTWTSCFSSELTNRKWNPWPVSVCRA